MNRIKLWIALLGICVFSGCAASKEIARTLWGSSTWALDQARSDAIIRIYGCSVGDCSEAVLSLTIDEKVEDRLVVAPLRLFLNDSKRKMMVVMGVPGAINTTEVGIYFESILENQTRVEVVSLSRTAAISASELIFEQLNSQFADF